MKMFRFLCIAPYDGMYQLMLNIAQQRSDVDIIVRMGNLDDGIKAVLEDLDDNVDAIISRGGTADAIRKSVQIPSFDIVPSAYDVLRTIRLASGLEEKFAIVGYPSITAPATMLCDIMQYNYQICTINSPDECKQHLLSLKKEGIRVIVGDMISTSCAHNLGMHGLLILSGMESIGDAIERAKRLCLHHAETKKKVDLLSCVLNTSEDSFLVYSPTGQEMFSTTKRPPDDVVASLIRIVPTVFAQKSITRVFQCDTVSYSVRGRAVTSKNEDYCVYSISANSSKEPFEKHRIFYLTADSDLPSKSMPLEYYWGRSEVAEKIYDTCERYAAMCAPVLIEGDRGTGKDRLAHYIYSRSPLKYSSFVYIDAELLEEKDWLFLVNSDQSPLTNVNLSIYFRRINAADPNFQLLLYNYLKNAPPNLNRLYFSYSNNKKYSIQEDLFLFLTDVLHCLRLKLPGLDKHREDIPAMVSLYINAVNIAHGTRVVGFTHEAMLVLQNMVWTRNAEQLFGAVQNLVTSADTSYISENRVKGILSLPSKAKADHYEASIDLSRSLDEITRDIVLQVYASENKNQTRTANRLKISRSTLWRILKNQGGK